MKLASTVFIVSWYGHYDVILRTIAAVYNYGYLRIKEWYVSGPAPGKALANFSQSSGVSSQVKEWVIYSYIRISVERYPKARVKRTLSYSAAIL